jgi:outer membrane protein assembly factor BamB
LGLLAACGERDVILPGERLNIRDGMAGQAPAVVANQARPIALGAASVNADWTQRNGGPTHRIAEPALAANLTQIFAVDIGEGNSRSARITSDPVVAGGVIYTMDARAQVTATGANGATLWTRNVGPANDNASSASGGGVAVAGGRLFVTTGYGALKALDAGSGGELWSQDLDAPGGSAPTVAGNLVYVAARDSRGWAVETDTGRIAWRLDGTPSATSFGGGAGAAVTPEIAILPFPSGEILAAFPLGGLRRWSANVSGERLGMAAASISDIAGDPVIDGRVVYAGNFSGRLVAMNVDNGDRLWTAVEGPVGPVWPAGGSVFLVNDLNELVRLDASDGTPIWRVALPRFEESRERRQKTVYAHYGPIIAGGRVIVASSDGVLRQFDPVSGALVGQVAVPSGAASIPVVANATLYVLNTRGQLVAFR